MKRLLLRVLSGFAVLVGVVACSTASAPRSAAIAIVMDGAGAPTADQIADVYAKMRPEIERRGYALAANPRMADVVVHVKYTPDLSGADGGRVSILTVASEADERQRTFAAREEFKESSAKANRNQVYEPR